ncbi:MAG TPA: septal ring lytic transglycosylase RlpA family protein [Thermoanaerobaculia bacterium]
MPPLATESAPEHVPAVCPNVDPLAAPLPGVADPGLLQRLLKYSQFHVKHRVSGLASYYSSFFHGRKTANGEIFRNNRYSAAHLTLPLGCWVEVKARATGKRLRLRVNDRGPYVKKFAIDLSQAAARYLGVDTARDRYVEFKVIALPGEKPLPEDVDWTLLERTQVSEAISPKG